MTEGEGREPAPATNDGRAPQRAWRRGHPRPDLPRRVRTAGSPPVLPSGAKAEAGSPLHGGPPPADRLATAAEEQRVRATFLRLRAATAALSAAANTARGIANHAFGVAERDAARQTHRALTGAEAEVGEVYDAIRTVLLGRAERLAPGPASAPWDAPEWRSADWLNTGGGRHLRIGALSVPGTAPHTGPALDTAPAFDAGRAFDAGTESGAGGAAADLPALVPLLDSGNLAVVGDSGRAADLLSGLVLRALATAPAGLLEIVVFDPRIRGAFSAFAGLRRASAQIMAEPVATAADFAVKLHELRAAVARVAELLGAHGVADLGALMAATGVHPEPHRLVVVLDYPVGVDQVVQDELLRLADGGPRRGVSVLVHHDPAAVSAHGVDAAALLALTVTVAGRAGALTVDALPGVLVRADPPPPRELITAVAERVAERAHRGAAPSVDFADLLPPRAQMWSRDAREGMTAVLGTAGFDRVELDLRGADPALPNALVGGASGQGKSNLLLVMLHSIAASYSPDEVEMYLLDFKDGLEFDRLGPRPDRPHWMPHVCVLGLEGDRLFGLAVLRHLEAEFRRRAELFRVAGQPHLAAYRQAHPLERVPRLLLVIDEFQVLIGADDDLTREAVGILETLARRGRAVGIHLVLASQTLSGIESLATKERSIFGQFPWRISLKTEASESEAVLGRSNTEAAQLRFRGEAILNREYGAPEHNRRATIAYADEQLLDRLREQWFARTPDPRPPRVFYASRPSDPAELPTALARLLADADADAHSWNFGGVGAPPAPETPRLNADAAKGGAAVLGLPVDVDPHPVAFMLRPDPGRALALIGEGRDAALGALSAAVWSLAAQDPPGGAEFVLLDGLAGAGSPTPELTTMADLARKRGHAVTEYGGRDLGRALLDLGERVDDRDGAEAKPLYVVAPGLHRASRLDEYGSGGARPGEALQRLVTEGPIANMYLLAWWSTLGMFAQQLRYETSALVGGYLFLRAPESDVQQVCGPFVRYSAHRHRALFWDRSLGAPPQVTVPFGVLSSVDVERLGGVR